MRFALPLALLIALAATAGAVVSVGPDGLTIIDAIDRSFDRGEINFDTQMLYYAYAVSASEKLPLEYQPYIHTLKSGTPVMMKIWANRDKISPGIWEQINDTKARPAIAGSYLSGSYPLYFHYTNATYATQANTCLGYANLSWATEVTSQGFDAPPPDNNGPSPINNYDMHIDPSLSGSGAMGVTFAESQYTGTTRFDMTSYICIAPNMSVPETQATVAHEFNHALQMGMDMAQMRLMETGAVYSEEVVYDSANDCHGYVTYFQGVPHKSLLDESGLFPYGTFLFYVFLEDRYFHTPNFYATMYRDSTQILPSNEPDIFDSLEDQLAGLSVSMKDMFHEFSIWRIFTGSNSDSHHWNETYPTMPGTVGSYTPGQLPAENFHPTFAWRPQKAGSSFVRFDTNSTAQPFTVCFSGETSVDWRVSLVCIKSDGSEPVVIPLVLSDQMGTVTVPDWSVYSKLYLAVTNMGDGNFDTEAGWSSSNDWHINAAIGTSTGIGVTNFAAAGQPSSVKLSWNNLEALPVAGFNIYRAPANASLPKTKNDLKNYTRINDHAITGSGSYSYLDNEVKNGRTYTYILTALDSNGLEQVCGNTTGGPRMTPASLSLAAPAPNPTSSTCSLRYSLSADSAINLDIYDLSGRLVRTVVSGNQAAGEYNAVWDGCDSTGRSVANGVYSVRLSSGTGVKSQRIVVAH